MHRKITKKPQYIQINNNNYTKMREFLAQTALTVLEEKEFRLRITDPSREFHFTQDMYHNRICGRTRVSQAERIAMLEVLNEIRAEQKARKCRRAKSK